MSSEYINNKALEASIVKFQDSKREMARYKLILQDLTDTIVRKSVRSTDCLKENELIITYQTKLNLSKESHHVSEGDLAKYFNDLSKNIVRYAKFNLIDPDDAIQEGVMICFEKINRFNPKKGKAFNYMTTCILNHLRWLFRTAKSYNEFKKRYTDHIQLTTCKNIIKNGKEVPVFNSLSSGNSF